MKKILAIDDQFDNLTIYEEIITNNLSNYKVLTALSGEEGIKKAKEQQPEVILLDIVMPKMDGFETCKLLKNDELTRYIPIIMITALETDTKSRIRGLNMGADVFLSKPIDPVEFTAQINVMLRIKQAEDKLRAEKDNLEKALISSEERYKYLVNNLPIGILHFDAKGVITDCNDEVIRILGSTREKLVGLNMIKQVPDQDIVNAVTNTLENGSAYLNDYYTSITGKKTTPLIARFKAISNLKNEIIGGMGMIEDISEQKLAEEEHFQSEIRFKRLFNGLGDAVFVTNIGGANKGNILEVNTAALEQTGYSKDELLEMNIIKDLSISGTAEISSDEWEEKLQKGETVRTIEKKKKKNGSEYWTEMIVTQIDFKGKKASLSINHDITNRILANKALKESEEKYRELIDTTSEGFWLLDSDLKTVDLNQALADMLGYTKEEIIGKSPLDFVDDANKKSFKNKASKVSSTSHRSYDIFLKKKNGIKFPAYLSATSIIDKNGNTTGSFAFVSDFTERKLAEEKAFKFSKLFEDSLNEIYLFDVDSLKFTQVNKAGIKNLGYSLVELRQMTPIDIKPKYDEKKFNAIIEPFLDNPYKKLEFQTIHKRKDGSTYFVEVNLQLIEFEGSKFFAAIIMDITKRKENEIQLKVILENSNTGFAINKISTGEVNYVNKAFTDAYHIPKEECKTAQSFFNYVYEDRKELGNKILADIQSRDPERMKWQAIPIIDKKTKKTTYISAAFIILEEQDLMISSVWDITERRESENRIKNALEKATESDRLKSAFLAAISHELRTPLNAIIGFSDLINEERLVKEVYDFGKIINESGIHLLSIVEEIFDLTMIESGEILINNTDKNLHSILYEVHKIIKTEQNKLNKESLDLNMIISENDSNLIINTDITKLKQILINLLKNALKFTAKGHINYGYSIVLHNDVKMLKFYVEDTGIGVSKDKQKIIFNTFRQVEESLSRTYGGTGIGLSISRKLTELLGGDIWIESTEGEGSTFYFTIPCLETNIAINTNEPVIIKKTENVDKLKEKTFLIVEDDETSFEFLQIVLEKPGINIIWAKNGKEAIEYCKNISDITLVLMDINMNVMDGYIATKEIKSLLPNLPIIAQTANAIAGDREKSLKAGCDDYISKPINITELMEKIEKLI